MGEEIAKAVVIIVSAFLGIVVVGRFSYNIGRYEVLHDSCNTRCAQMCQTDAGMYLITNCPEEPGKNPQCACMTQVDGGNN